MVAAFVTVLVIALIAVAARDRSEPVDEASPSSVGAAISTAQSSPSTPQASEAAEATPVTSPPPNTQRTAPPALDASQLVSVVVDYPRLPARGSYAVPDDDGNLPQFDNCDAALDWARTEGALVTGGAEDGVVISATLQRTSQDSTGNVPVAITDFSAEIVEWRGQAVTARGSAS